MKSKNNRAAARLFQSSERFKCKQRVNRKKRGDGVYGKVASVNHVVFHTKKIQCVKARKGVNTPEYGKGNQHRNA